MPAPIITEVTLKQNVPFTLPSGEVIELRFTGTCNDDHASSQTAIVKVTSNA